MRVFFLTISNTPFFVQKVQYPFCPRLATCSSQRKLKPGVQAVKTQGHRCFQTYASLCPHMERAIWLLRGPEAKRWVPKGTSMPWQAQGPSMVPPWAHSISWRPLGHRAEVLYCQVHPPWNTSFQCLLLISICAWFLLTRTHYSIEHSFVLSVTSVFPTSNNFRHLSTFFLRTFCVMKWSTAYQFCFPIHFSHKSGACGGGGRGGLSRNASRGSRDLCGLGSLGQSSPRAREAPHLNLSHASVFRWRLSSSSSLVCTCRLLLVIPCFTQKSPGNLGASSE